MTRNHPPLQVALTNGSKTVYDDTGHFIEACRPEDPVYLFCPSVLEKQSQRIQDGFPGLTSFAVKANPQPVILDSLSQSGIQAFDVASLEEIKLVHRQVPDAVMHFNNPVKQTTAIEQAYRDFGIRSFVVDDFAELTKIQSIVGDDTNLEISVRFKIARDEAAYDFTSKFGASKTEAIKLLQAVKAAAYRPSMTFHPGSQCKNPDAYADYIQAAAEISRLASVPLYRLNVGGGFPARYLENTLPSLELYFETINNAFAAGFAGSQTRLLCEPGRCMVASCCSLLTKVIHRRDNGSLFLNDGIYGGLMEQMLVNLHLPLQVWRNNSPLVGETGTFELFGPTCDSVDKLPTASLPLDIRAGDYIEYGCLGAYGSSTTTGFNGFRSDTYRLISKQTDFFQASSV
ncbi:MAG: type III PLP-dependent enzyme [Gammaproteobacteria bacterium]|nr:type III PLP-dependent enzyme [Gammaproteobacteria bacterium]